MAALAINPVEEKEALTLLATYRQIFSFEEALKKFEADYDTEYRASIQSETSNAGVNGGDGIETYEQAYQLLVDTKFIANKTTYKKVGLITGIDPEYWPEFRRDPSKLPAKWDESISDFFDFSNTFDILYEPGQKVQKYGLSWTLGATGGRLNSNEAILFQNSISQYFLDLGIYINKRGPSSNSGDLYLNFLRGSIFGLLKQMLAAALTSPRTPYEQGFINDSKANIENRIQQIDSHMAGNLPSKDITKYKSSIWYFESDHQDSQGYLQELVRQAVFGTSSFGLLIAQTDSILNQIYLDRERTLPEKLKISDSTGADAFFSIDPVVLVNRQLQDILAFFGDAAPRTENDTPEASVRSIEEAPESAKNATQIKANLTPFDFQCFLLENISKLVEEREAGKFQTNYKNIVKVSTNGSPGNIINTIQHGGRDDSVKALLNICPEVYGLLTPYIKISRLDYDKFGNIAIDPDTKRSRVRDLEIPNFLSQNDISSILSGVAGRAPGAGIKSFSWSLDGVQPAEVDNNITATLVMYFQSVNDFFNGASSAGQENPNFLDLIINSPAVKKLKEKKSENKDPTTKPCEGDLLRTEMHRDYEGRNFRVKICAGWSTPPEGAILELVGDVTKKKNLIKAIDDSRISLFLQMTKHQINFNQNGSLELTVNYQASLAGLLSGKTANIFDDSPTLIDEDIERQQAKIEMIEGDDERRGAATDSSKEKKKAALEEIKELRNIDKNVKYKKLLKKIYSSNKIHNISLNPNELSMRPYGELTPKERQQRLKRKEDNNTYDIVGTTQVNKELLDALDKNAEADSTTIAEVYSDNATKTFDQLADQTKINIPFFYLGDLLDMVLEEIKTNNKNNSADGVRPLNFNFFISDVEMIDPLQAFKAENLEELMNCGYDLRDIVFLDSVATVSKTKNGIYRSMNIGDIPISLDAFQLWFKNNVIKKNRDNYFFLYFVKDVCKGLITQSLAKHCFGKEIKFQQRFDTQPMTLSKQETKISNFRPNDSVSSITVAASQAAVTCGLDPADTELGLLLYPTDSNPKDLKGRFKPDLERGIYHHYLGSSCGLVKQINFQREDQAFLRETRIQKEGALGAEQLRELYSANIELVGNTLYKNGMYIYINPSLLGADQAYLDYLGLHGYYMITKVESKVTPNGFDVSIRALHEGIEFGGTSLQPTQVNASGYTDALAPEENPHINRPRPLDYTQITSTQAEVILVEEALELGPDAANDLRRALGVTLRDRP